MSFTKLGRVTRRHNKLVDRYARLSQLIKDSEPQAWGLGLLNNLLGAAGLDLIPEQALPIPAGDTRKEIVRRVASAIKAQLDKVKAKVRAWADDLPAPFNLAAPVLAALVDLAGDVGARLVAALLVAMVNGLSREGRLAALRTMLEQLTDRARILAAPLGITLVGGTTAGEKPARFRYSAPDEDDKDDVEVVEALPAFA